MFLSSQEAEIQCTEFKVSILYVKKLLLQRVENIVTVYLQGENEVPF
jgi:hypothetical protein